MPQLYASSFTIPAESQLVGFRSQACVAGGVWTFTCQDAAGADCVLLQCTAAVGAAKFNVQFVGDAAPADPTSYNTVDLTGIGWSIGAHTPMLLYAGREEGGGKKKILTVRVFTGGVAGQLTASFLNVNLGVALNG